MQCASCQFQNMPGVEVCGRCGTSLRLATADIDVHPPRAGAGAKRLRRLLLVGRLAGWFQGATADAARRANLPLPERAVLARLIVPGWAHFYLGQHARGRVFLGVYLALLLASLLALGSPLAALLFGLAFSAHASAALDVLFPRLPDLPARVTAVIMVMLLLSTGLYVPVLWLVSRVADTQTVDEQRAPFERGDVVLCNRWAYLRSSPQPGDVVLYELPGANIAGGHGENAAVRIAEGLNIDRVLAGPGARVVCERGQLTIDGSPAAWLPLNPGGLPARLSLTVPQGSYLILPSTVTFAVHGQLPAPAGLLERISVVPAGHIEGSVYLRVRPLTRFGRVR